MKDQLQTIREALDKPNDTSAWHRARQAVAQLEAMAGEQEPMAEAVAMPGTSGFTMAALRTRWDQTLRHQVAQQPQADRERCIEARNALNEALHGPGALIDSLEEAVEAACRKLKQPQAELQRYSLDGEGGMEIDSLGAWVKLRDVKQQPQAECRNDGRCQYAIDSGAEGLGHCPKGKCVMQQSHAKTAEVFHCKTCGCTMQMPHDDCLACERGAPQQADAVPPTQAAQDVLAERQRQISAEGWTPKHDDDHKDGSMALAAACYACNAATWAERAPRLRPEDYVRLSFQGFRWPWAAKWWKPKSQRHDLVKAGALILAEIERLDRAAAKKEAGHE